MNGIDKAFLIWAFLGVIGHLLCWVQLRRIYGDEQVVSWLIFLPVHAPLLGPIMLWFAYDWSGKK